MASKTPPTKPRQPLKPGQRRALPGQRGVYERMTKDGTVKYDALVTVTQNGKSETLHLGTRDEVGDAVALVAAYHFKRRAAENPAEAASEDASGSGLLTVRQLGRMCLEATGGKRYDWNRWNGRVCNAFFIDWPATQVTDNDVQRWIDDAAHTALAVSRNAGKPPAHGTVYSALSLLARVYRWAKMPARKYVTHNPCDGVTIMNSTDVPLQSARNVFDYLPEDEAIKVMGGQERLGMEKWAKFVTLMFAGPRPGDLWRLDWSRVDWRADLIRFHSRKTSKRKAHDYAVHMLPPLRHALRQWWLKCGRPTSGLVFPNPKTGKPYAEGYDAGWQDKRERRKNVWYVDTTEDKSLSTGGTHRRYLQRSRAEAKRLRREHGERRESVRELKITPGWRTKLGIKRDVPLYSLRHTCACNLLLGSETFTGGRRFSREEVQAHLGHLTAEATEHYMVALGLAAGRAVADARKAMAESRAWLAAMD